MQGGLLHGSKAGRCVCDVCCHASRLQDLSGLAMALLPILLVLLLAMLLMLANLGGKKTKRE